MECFRFGQRDGYSSLLGESVGVDRGGGLVSGVWRELRSLLPLLAPSGKMGDASEIGVWGDTRPVLGASSAFKSPGEETGDGLASTPP